MLKQTKEVMYSSNEVAAVARATLRELQWWDEHNVIHADFVGRERRYNVKDLVQAVVIAALRRRGISLQKIRGYWPQLRCSLAKAHAALESSCTVIVVANSKLALVFEKWDAVFPFMADSSCAWTVIELNHELGANAALIREQRSAA